jgi:hypothetical protein
MRSRNTLKEKGGKKRKYEKAVLRWCSVVLRDIAGTKPGRKSYQIASGTQAYS